MTLAYWYCPDCDAKGCERGDPDAYETLRIIGIEHRAFHHDGGKCLGMCIRVGDKSVWPRGSRGLLPPVGRHPDAPEGR